MDDYSLTRNGYKSSPEYDDMVAYGGFVTLPEPVSDLDSGSLDWASATHAGLVRLHNEDSHRLKAESSFFVLADGMGGYNAGEVASAIAADCMVEHVQGLAARPPHEDPTQARMSAFAALERMRQGVLLANKKILETAARRPECLGMGTTLAAVSFHPGWIACVHVGDSRIYRWRDRKLVCLTKDHSVGQEMIEAGLVNGEEARTIAARGILTRAVGAEAYIDVDAAVHAAQVNDIYLVCSDGLTDMVDDSAISKIIGANISDGPQELCNMLINESLAGGGSDNVTVIALQIVR